MTSAEFLAEYGKAPTTKQLKAAIEKGAKHKQAVLKRMEAETPQAKTQALGRMKAGKMNKTEAAYAAVLDGRKHTGEVAWYAFEPINIRLADKCFYSPDFMVMLSSGEIEIHEVKGFWTDDALVKIKVAATILPFKFIAVRLEKGQWIKREF
jgi:hypothetical protein